MCSPMGANVRYMNYVYNVDVKSLGLDNVLSLIEETFQDNVPLNKVLIAAAIRDIVQLKDNRSNFLSFADYNCILKTLCTG